MWHINKKNKIRWPISVRSHHFIYVLFMSEDDSIWPQKTYRHSCLQIDVTNICGVSDCLYWIFFIGFFGCLCFVYVLLISTLCGLFLQASPKCTVAIYRRPTLYVGHLCNFSTGPVCAVTPPQGIFWEMSPCS